jgi:hypothetical protein
MKMSSEPDELSRLRKEVGVLREALADFDEAMTAIGGCPDGYCFITGKATGMHTNGGCRCWKHPDHITVQRYMRAARKLRDHLGAALSQGKEEPANV